MQDLDIRQLFERLEQGKFLTDVDEEMRQLMALVKERGNKGVITIKIEVNPSTPGEPMVTFRTKVQMTKPTKAIRGAFIYFQDGRMADNDPRSPEMPLGRTVESSFESRSVDRADDSRKVE